MFTRTPGRHAGQKPRSGDRIDWQHPLARGLQFYAPLTEVAGPPVDLVQGSIGVVTGATRASGSGDLQFTANNSNNVDWGVNPAYQNTVITAACEIVITASPTGTQNIFENRTFGSTGFGFNLATTNTLQGRVFGTGIGGSLTIVPGARYIAVLTYDNVTATLYLYDAASRTLTTSSGATSGGLSVSSVNTIRIGDDTTGNRSFGGSLRWAAFWNRPFTPSEVARLLAEPYAFIAPGPVSRYPAIPVTPPVAPTGLTATNAPAPVLAWGSVTGATSYLVRRGATGGARSTIATVFTNAYTDAAATPGNVYDYSIAAVNGGGTSADSNVATAYTEPTAPAQLAGTSGNGKVILSAAAATGGGAVTYNVYDGTSVGAEGGVAVLTGQTNPASMVVAGLTNGQKYFFFATAQNAAGESLHSNETGVIPALGGGGSGIGLTFF